MPKKVDIDFGHLIFKFYVIDDLLREIRRRLGDFFNIFSKVYLRIEYCAGKFFALSSSSVSLRI
jgi:hypothetical protein